MADIILKHIYSDQIDSRRAIDDVSFEVNDFRIDTVSGKDGKAITLHRSRIIAFVGDRDSGKSDILSAFSGKTKLVSGQILIDGKEVSTLPKLERYIFSVYDGLHLDPEKSLFNNIVEVCEADMIPYEAIVGRAYFIFDLFGISKVIDRKYSTLNIVEKYLAHFALAYIHLPKIYVVDSPFRNTMLSSEERTLILEKLALLGTAANATILYGTDQASDFRYLMKDDDYVLVIRNGKILQQGTTEDIRRYPHSLDVLTYIEQGKFNLMDAKVTIKSLSATAYVPDLDDNLLNTEEVQIRARLGYILGEKNAKAAIPFDALERRESMKTAFEAVVDEVENKDSYLLVSAHIVKDGTPMKPFKFVHPLRKPPAPGELIHIRRLKNTQEIYFFDAETGLNLIQKYPSQIRFTAKIDENRVFFISTKNIAVPEALYTGNLEESILSVPNDALIDVDAEETRMTLSVISCEEVSGRYPTFFAWSGLGRSLFGIMDHPYTVDEDYSMNVDFTKLRLNYGENDIWTPLEQNDTILVSVDAYQSISSLGKRSEEIQSIIHKRRQAVLSQYETELNRENNDFGDRVSSNALMNQERKYHKSASGLKIALRQKRFLLSMVKQKADGAIGRLNRELEKKCVGHTQEEINALKNEYYARIIEIRSKAERELRYGQLMMEKMKAEHDKLNVSKKEYEKVHKERLATLAKEKETNLAQTEKVSLLGFTSDYHLIVDDEVQKAIDMFHVNDGEVKRRFILHLPHDAYTIIEDENAEGFPVTVESASNYGTCFVLRCRYFDENDNVHFLFVKSKSSYKSGKNLVLKIDISKLILMDEKTQIVLYA